MRKLAIATAPAAALLAAAAFIIRKEWWNNALEYVKAPPSENLAYHSETLVVRRGAIESYLLVGLFVLAVIAAFSIAFICKSKLETKGYRLSLKSPSDTPVFVRYLMLVAGAAGAALLLICGVGLVTAGDGFARVCAAAAFLSAAAVAAVPFSAMLRKPSKTNRLPVYLTLLSLFPEILMTLLLVSLYRDNQTDPVILRYAPAALAFAFSAMSYYSDAAFVFSKVVPARSIFFKFCAIVTAGAALADIPHRAVGIKNISGAEKEMIFWGVYGFALVTSLILALVTMLSLSFSFTRRINNGKQQ